MSKNTVKILIKFLAKTPKYNNIRIYKNNNIVNTNEKYYFKYGNEGKILERIKEEEKIEKIENIPAFAILYLLITYNIAKGANCIINYYLENK